MIQYGYHSPHNLARQPGDMDVPSRTPKLSPLFLIAVLSAFAALCVHIVAPILAWQWVQRPSLGVMFEHTLIVVRSQDNWIESPTGLHPRDRIVAVNGIRVDNHRDLAAALFGLHVGDAVVLTVEHRGPTSVTEAIDVPVTLGLSTIPDLIERFVMRYLVGLAYLGFGIWMLLQVRDKRAQLFSCFCALASIIASASFDASSTHTLIRLWILAFPATAAALLGFGLSLLPNSASQRVISVGRMGMLAVLCLVAISTQLTLYGPEPRSYLVPWLVSFGTVGLALVGFLGIVGLIWRRPSRVRVRLQAQIILAGAATAFSPALVWLCAFVIARSFPVSTWLDRHDALVVLPSLLVFPAAAAYALLHYPKLETKLVSRPGYLDPEDYKSLIRTFTRELAASPELDHVIEKLLSYVGSAFKPRYVLAFLISEADTYEFYSAWGQLNAELYRAIRFTHRDSLVARLQHTSEGLLLQSERGNAIEPAGSEWAQLESLSIALVVPLLSQNHLLGFLALGPLESRDVYDTEDVTLLSTMAEQAAVVAENALLHSRQQDQEQQLMAQTRRLTDILALGNQLKSLDRDIVVKSTVQAVHERLGFGLVTLSLVDENDSSRVRVVAWAGADSQTWERLASTTFPLLDFGGMADAQQIERCYFVRAPGSSTGISTSHNMIEWCEGDQLYVPLVANDELLGYLTLDRPEDRYRPTDPIIEVLEIFANQATVAIQNASLYARIDRALDERIAELATLQEIDTQLNVKLDFDYVMNTTLEWAMRITAASAGTLALTSRDGASLDIVAHKGYQLELENHWNIPWSAHEGIIGQVLATGEAVMDTSASTQTGYSEIDFGPQCYLAAPIIREDHVTGVISLESTRLDGFSVEHKLFLQRLADHAAIVIENVRLYEQTSRRVAELSALQQISLDLTSSLNLGAVLESVAANTLDLTRADVVTIYLYDQHEDTLVFGTGLSSYGKADAPPVPIAKNGLTRDVARQGTPKVIDNKIEAQRYLPESGIRSIASIPLQKGEIVLGVFDIAFTSEHSFSLDEMRALGLLADQAAIAIQNAQLYLDVQRANEAKSEFVSIVSHELKVPMTSIQGYARLMTLGAAGSVSQQQIEFANTILKNVERMANLVNDLLDLSRIDSGRIQITPRPIDIGKVVDDVVREMRDQVEDREHKLIINLPADLPAVYADPARVMQVWTNLLSNAVKYTPRGGRIQVWANRYDSDRDAADRQWIRCAVEDNGIGIAPEDQDRVFEQFYRIRNPQTNKEPGTGLGLSIAQSIVELHGGHIWFDSTPGKGSTFYFTLPTSQSVPQEPSSR